MDEIAKEVISGGRLGKWKNESRVIAVGYDYEPVQKRVMKSGWNQYPVKNNG